MKVEIHTLFQYLLETTQADPEAFVGFSLSTPPKLGEFLDDLDPDMPLDWNLRDFRGLPELRQHVLHHAGLSQLCGIEDVLITAGAAEANYLAIMQLVAKGEEIVTDTPGWPQAGVLARAAEAKLTEIPRDEAAGWTLPLDRLREAVTPRTRLIFLTNPNNPTGRLFREDELREIVDIARANGTWVIMDEVYAGLEWGAARPTSIAALYERGITTGSVSKALGLQGLRTGWLICRDAGLVMDAVIRRENSSEIMNVMGEVIAEIALRPDRYTAALNRARGEASATLDHLDSYIADQPLLTWQRPEAGLIGMARLLADLDGDAFAQRLLDDPYRTFLLPGSAYGLAQHIRVGVGGGAAAKLDLGLQRMAALLATF